MNISIKICQSQKKKWFINLGWSCSRDVVTNKGRVVTVLRHPQYLLDFTSNHTHIFDPFQQRTLFLPCTITCTVKTKLYRPSEMAYWVKVSATKPADVSSILGTHMTEEKNNTDKLSFDFHIHTYQTQTYACTHIHIPDTWHFQVFLNIFKF